MAHRLQSWIGSAIFAAGLSLCALAGTARAETVAPCTGPHPVAGVQIRGPVLHVIDGDTINGLKLFIEPFRRTMLDDRITQGLRTVHHSKGSRHNTAAVLVLHFLEFTLSDRLRNQAGDLVLHGRKHSLHVSAGRQFRPSHEKTILFQGPEPRESFLA